MFYISSNGLKKMAADTRKFAFVGSGVNAVTNIIGWAVMKDGYSPLLVAAMSVLWFIAFQFGALMLCSIAESNRSTRNVQSVSRKRRINTAKSTGNNPRASPSKRGVMKP
jgi:hypothetical protein